MISNCREIPELVSFANKRGILVFFNTVVFPADHSIKTLPRHVQDDLLHLYRTSLPALRNDTEIANDAALEGFCRQIEFWMEKGEHHSLLEERCTQWLESGQNSDGVAALLSDLAGNNAGPDGPLLQIGSGEPFQSLKAYVEAIWEVGGRLQSEGLLSNTRFDIDELRVFLSYLDGKADLKQARRIYTEMRRFPNEILNFSGTLSASKLTELIEAHFAH